MGRPRLPKKTPGWAMPDWMKPFARLFCNTGREPTVEAIEYLYNDTADPRINLPLSMIECGVKSQVGMLYQLHKAGLLK